MHEKKLRVLVSAFACNPYEGSEPGIGWGWVVSLAKVCDLSVVTTTCNRESIEKAICDGNDLKAEFIYLDVMSGIVRLNQRAKSKVGVLVRLFIWQCRLRKYLEKKVKEHDYDILHHITLGSFKMPFSVTNYRVISVVGPVGGCEEFPKLLLPQSSYSIRSREILRNWMNRVYTQLGFGMKRYRAVDLTLSCTREMSEVFAKHGVESPVFPNIGMLSEEIVRRNLPRKSHQGLRLLFVGNLLYWKGLELALLALQKLPNTVSLSIIGEGADKGALEADISRLGLGSRVNLLGHIPRAELLAMYQNYDVFFYPSLHDSGAMSVIEAMRAGLPVICLDAGGPALSVNSECGRVVPLGSKLDVVDGLKGAVVHYFDKPDLIVKHGEAASLRVNEEYNWDENARRVVHLYYEALKKR